MSSILKSFAYAFKGFKFVWKEERNFRVEVGVAAVALATAAILHFSYLEFAIIILTIFLVLAAEAINTILEDALNKLEPKYDPIIGKIKDICAFFVLLTVIAAILVGAILLFHHLNF
ncbi:MAG TPA: diacylglycerol kinase family protein [Candidatus Paceibacterota bacterium]|nr:diacylglycerol kinase family protein [Candidatus Paceibacterota bacterium]